VQGSAIDFAENGNGVDAQFAARPLDANCDFAAIGNQDFLEHRRIYATCAILSCAQSRLRFTRRLRV
jgi:hypothetical protein